MGWGKLHAVSDCYVSLRASADGRSVSIRGTEAAEWDKNTWGPLEDLAQNHPEAGVHFQGKVDATAWAVDGYLT